MSDHNRLLIALWLTPDGAARLALSNGEPADQLHLTLCYCGDVDALGADVVSRALDAVGQVATVQAALTGRISGVGRFNASTTSDDKDVFYASVDMPGLVELRVALSEALTAAGAPPRPEHGFDPHITLAQLNPDDPNPIDKLPAVELRLDALTVEAGAERRLFTLKVTEDNMNQENPNAVKFTGDAKDKIEGWGIPYGGPINGKDVHRQFFSAKTQFALDWFDERPLLYAHGFDEELELVPVGRVKSWVVKDKGVWVEAQIDQSNEYFKDIQRLIDEKRLFFSSGSVDHLVQVNKKTGEIETWPWIELSLTPRPANLFASLDFATAEKHCKDAGIDMPIAVKDAMAIRSRETATKGIYERKLQEAGNCIWQLWNYATSCFEEVARAASLSDVTGVEIDVTTKVTEIVAEFNARLVPAVVEQITEYLKQDRSEQNFYLKSVSLDELINDNSRAGLPFAQHLAQVRAAVAGFTKRTDEIHAIREGRSFSGANLQKLADLHGQMGECHQKMGALIEAGQPKPKDESAKSADSTRRARAHRFLTLKQFSLSSDAASEA